MNWIEKKLPKTIRDRLFTSIATAFGLFLALRYNDFMRHIIELYIPGNSIIQEAILLIVLTLAIVYGGAYLESALDGK